MRARERRGARSSSPPTPSQPAITAIRFAAASTAADDRADRDGGRALPGSERLQRGAGGLVLRAAARVAARTRLLGRACRAPPHPAAVRRPGLRDRRRRLARSAALRAPSSAYDSAPTAASSSAARSAAAAAARVRRVADCAHHDDARGACRDHLAHVTEVDPADREPGPVAGDLGGVAHVVEPGRRAALLRGRRPHRARRSAGRPRRTPSARVELLRRVGREPDQDLVARRAPRASRAGMSSWPTCTPSAPHAHDQVRPVVQPEQRAVLVAQPPEHGGRAHELVVARRPCRGAGPCPPRRRAPPRAAPRGPAAHR